MIDDAELYKGMITLKTIWAGMLLSLAIYLFIGLKFGPNIEISLPPDAVTILKYALYSLAVITFIITNPLRKRMLSGKLKIGAQTPRYPGQDPVVQKYTSAAIFSFALSESIGIYGLVLYILGKNTTDFYLLIFFSAAALLICFPKEKELLRLDETINPAPEVRK